MAASNIPPAFIATVPQEILQMIFRSLARPELKSVRLVSKEFDNAAKVFLFRQILPRRNMDSFCKVRLIRSKPHLAKFVKALAYSGKTLWHGDGEADYGRWYQERIGQGQMASQQCDEIERRMESVTTDELHQYYQRFCQEYHGEEIEAFSDCGHQLWS